MYAKALDASHINLNRKNVNYFEKNVIQIFFFFKNLEKCNKEILISQ